VDGVTAEIESDFTIGIGSDIAIGIEGDITIGIEGDFAQSRLQRSTNKSKMIMASVLPDKLFINLWRYCRI